MATSLKDQILDVSRRATLPSGQTFEETGRSQFRRGFDVGANALKRGVLGSVQLAGETAGLPGVARFGAEGAQRAQEEATTLPPLAQPRATKVDWSNIDDVLDFVGGAAGLAAPSLAAAVGTGLAVAATGGGALPALAAAGLTSAVPEAGSTYLDILEQTGERAPGTSALTGLAAGALDALGAGRVAKAAIPQSIIRQLVQAGIDPDRLARLGLMRTGRSVVAEAIKAGGVEAGTEAAQGFIGDIGRGQFIEGIDPLDVERRIDEAAIGLVGGTSFPLATQGSAFAIDKVTGLAGTAKDKASAAVKEAVAPFDEGQPQPGDPDFVGHPDRPPEAQRQYDATGRPVKQPAPEPPIDEDFPNQPPERKARVFRPVEGAEDLTKKPHIQEGGDADIQYSRGLQGVERALAEGRLGMLSDTQMKNARQAASMARAALESPDAPLTDSEVEFIKKAFSVPGIRMLFNEAKAIEDLARRGGIDIEGTELAIDTPELVSPINEDPDPGPEAYDVEVDQGVIDEDTREFQGLSVSGPVEIGTGRYILPGPNNSPLVTVEASKAAAELSGVSGVKLSNGLQKRVDALNAKSKKQRYEAVPYSEIIEEQARDIYGRTPTPQELQDFKNSRATALFNELVNNLPENARFSVTNLFDPENPAAFLDNYGAIKQVGQKPIEQELDLPAETFVVAKPTTNAQGKIVGGEKSVFLSKPATTSFDNPPAGMIEAKLDGRRVQMNLMNLTNTFFKKKVSRPDEEVPLFQRVKDAFSAATSSLLNDPNHNVEINFEGINPDTVAYRTSEGIEFTYGQLTKGQSLVKQHEDMANRLVKVLRAIDQEKERLTQTGVSEVLQSEARKRLAQLERREAAINRNLEVIERKINSGSSETAKRAIANVNRERGADLDIEREITGIIEVGPEPLEPGGARKAKTDTSPEAAAAIELIERKMSISNAAIAINDSWKAFVDRVFDRAGIEPPLSYLPQNVLYALAKKAGVGTPNVAITQLTLKMMDKTRLMDIAVGKRTKGAPRPSRADVQKAMDAQREVHEARVDKAVRTFLKDYMPNSTPASIDKIMGDRKNLAETVNNLAALRPGSVAEFLNKDPSSIKIRQGVDELLVEINKAMGVTSPSAAIMSNEEGVYALRGRVSAFEILTGNIGGFHILSRALDGQPAIYVSPMQDPLSAAQTLTHEYGHYLTKVTDFGAEHDPKGIINEEFLFAYRAVNKEYEEYRDSVLGDMKVTVEQVVGARLPGNLARTMTREDMNVPFSTLPESFKQYYLSRDEWLADRVAAQIAGSTKGNKAIKAFLDNFQNAYSHILFGQYPTTKGGLLELYNLWLPSSAKVRNDVDAFLEAKKMKDDPTIMFSRAPEATPRSDSDAYKKMDRLVKRVLDISLSELANKWSDAGNMEPRDILSKLMMIAETDMHAAESVVHNQMMRYALKRMLTPEEIALLGRVATSPFVMRQLNERLVGSEAALKLIADPASGVDAAIAYAYQFSITDPTFKLGAAPTTLFHKVHVFFADLLKIVNESASAKLAFEVFHQGTRSMLWNTDSDHFRAYEADIFGPDASFRNSAMQKFERWYRQIDPINASQTKIRNFKNPVLTKIAQQFSSKIGETSVGRTFFEERQIETGVYMNRVHKIMSSLNETQLGEYTSAVHNYKDMPADISPEAKRAVEDTFLLMDDMLTYLKKANVDVGPRGEKVTIRGREVIAYFPWRFDPAKILGHLDEIRSVLKRPEYEKQLQRLVRRRAASVAPEARGSIDSDAVIDAILFGILNSGGAADVYIEDTVKNFAPGMQSIMTRELWWLMEDTPGEPAIEQSSRELWTRIMDDNVYNTMETYVDQAVKRAAFTRRFGVLGEKLTRAMLRAKENGATDEELKYTQQFVQAMLGSHGRMTHIKINSAINWVSNKLGRGNIVPKDPEDLINPKFAKMQQILMTYQNLRLLDFAVFTSLVDPAGIAVRSSSVPNAWRSFKAGFNSWGKNHWKGEQDYVNSVAKLLGIVEHHMTNESLQQAYGGTWMSGRTKQVNDALFKYTGLHGWTRITRLMATSSALQFLHFHANTPVDETAEYLSDLGLRPGDLTPESFRDGEIILMDEGTRAYLQSGKIRDSDGNLVPKSPEQRKADMKLYERDERIRTAIVRYTNEAILRPNASQRPVWASDPHFAIIFHLKQFMWSFVETTLGVAAHQAKNGRYAPLMITGLLFPTGMAGVDALRDWLRYGSEGAPSMRGADWFDYASRAVQRSGLMGFTQLGLDAQRDIQYGGFGVETLLGPSIGHVMELLKVPGSDTRTMEDFLLRALPLQNTTKAVDHLVL